MTRLLGLLALLISFLVAEQAFCLGSQAGKEAKIHVKKIMDTEENIIGQKIVYPTGVAHITSEVIECRLKPPSHGTSISFQCMPIS